MNDDFLKLWKALLQQAEVEQEEQDDIVEMIQNGNKKDH